jgi:hypothetical protein
MYDFIQKNVADYEREIFRKLAAMQREEFAEQPAPKRENPRNAKARRPGFYCWCADPAPRPRLPAQLEKGARELRPPGQPA